MRHHQPLICSHLFSGKLISFAHACMVVSSSYSHWVKNLQFHYIFLILNITFYLIFSYICLLKISATMCGTSSNWENERNREEEDLKETGRLHTWTCVRRPATRSSADGKANWKNERNSRTEKRKAKGYEVTAGSLTGGCPAACCRAAVTSGNQAHGLFLSSWALLFSWAFLWVASNRPGN